MTEWIGTLTSIIGAFLVASKMAIIGYAFFVVGSLAWLIVACRTHNKALGVLNATFLCANIIGLLNYA